MKKVILYFLVLAMITALASPVYATSNGGLNQWNKNLCEFECDDPRAESYPEGNCENNSRFDDTLNANDRSLSIPTDFYDLSLSDYYASLVCVGSGWLFTNYYFYCNSNNEIYVNYSIYSDTGRPTMMDVGLYDLDLHRIVATWRSSGTQLLIPLEEGFRFINLDSSHKYAVAFIAVFDGFSHDTVHGSAVINH